MVGANDKAGRPIVVVTGMGIVSSIGNSTQEVLASLREAKSGISRADKYAELGFRCQVHAPSKINWEERVDRRAARFLAPGTGYAHIAMEEAIADSGLQEGEVSHERTGLLIGAVVNLFASTSGTDSDWVVKLIDVYPDEVAGQAEAYAAAGLDLAPADAATLQGLLDGKIIGLEADISSRLASRQTRTK